MIYLVARLIDELVDMFRLPESTGSRIDKIVRKSYSEYVIMYEDGRQVTCWSSGNAAALLEFVLEHPFGTT